VTSIVLMYAAETQIANGIPEKELRYFWNIKVMEY
jgi:hypothetical protein